MPLHEATDRIDDIKVVFLGQDAYIEKVKSNVRDDLHEELRQARKEYESDLQA